MIENAHRLLDALWRAARGAWLLPVLLVAQPATAQPATDHPRLWVRSSDLTALRARATAANPLYADGLAPLAAAAKQAMDDDLVPDTDSGGTTWEQYPSEMYAQLFAFLSLVEPDSAVRDDYAARARTLLMHVMDQAALGEADAPFRHLEFSTYDRSRWWGEGFPLTVDWIYPYLSADDKSTIRDVFIRWCAENAVADTTDYNHPEPIGVVNDPALLSDPLRVRWSANNYYLSHLRNMGLMALSFDAVDDPGGTLTDYLETATGAWLYVTDALLRGPALGGMSPEGLLYGPDALGSLAHFMLALHTSGNDDPLLWGDQVVWSGHPFWVDVAPAFLHSLSPTRVTYPDTSWIGPVFQPAWYGDGQEYWLHDPISLFAPVGLHAESTGDGTLLDTARWIQLNAPPGGPGADGWATLADRIATTSVFRDAILYFLLFDPAETLPADPRPSLGTRWRSPGVGRTLARTGWDEGASVFTHYLGWTWVDHQLSEGNQVELYRGGEWLTKGRVGWDGTSELCTIGRSDYHNTVAVENDVGDLTSGDWLYPCQQNGSQFMQLPDGEGEVVAVELDDDFVYLLGDATDLYNSSAVSSTSVTHVSRSTVWFPPDRVVVYDRLESSTAGFKRFWLNLPADGSITGDELLVETPGGQRLFVHALAPAGAALSTSVGESFPDVAVEEPMSHRFLAEAPGDPLSTRFLHTLEGRDGGAAPSPVSHLVSSSGTPFEGALMGDVGIVFPTDLDTAFSGTTVVVPGSYSTLLVAGLEPGGAYTVTETPQPGGTEVTVAPGGPAQAGPGGVLVVGGAEAEIFSDGFESGTTSAWSATIGG